MTYVIYLIEDAATQKPVGEWLKSYDPAAFGGRGKSEGTLDPREAMQFATASLAMRCWNAVPANKPLRDDGRPNKPLTAFTVEIQRADSLPID